MKKLLALLLCVMLLVSAVPTGAHALDSETTEKAMMSLYDKAYVYDPAESLNDMKHLVNAYGALGGAHLGKIMVTGTEALWKSIDAEKNMEDLYAAYQAGTGDIGNYGYGLWNLYMAEDLMRGMPYMFSDFYIEHGLMNPLSYYGLGTAEMLGFLPSPLALMYEFRNDLGVGLAVNTDLAGDTVLADAKAEAARIEEAVTAGTAQVLAGLGN